MRPHDLYNGERLGKVWPKIRGQYHKFLSVMRARTGRYANEDGIAAAAEKFSHGINFCALR